MTLATGGEVALRFRNGELSRDGDRAPEAYRAQEKSGELHGRILAARVGSAACRAGFSPLPGVRRSFSGLKAALQA